MKKFIALAAALILIISLLPAAAAGGDSVKINMTVSSAGELVVINKSVTVSDKDGDGSLTVNDALIAVHDAYFNGGSAAGYVSAKSSWGLSINKLWGIENGGSYGYYLNNVMCLSLTEAVKDGDYLVAYSYADLKDWSDCYSFFDKTEASGASVTLTLKALSYDANWNLVSAPAAGSVIYIDGKATESKTDANGKVTLSFAAAGTYTVSAKSDSMTIVPPVCIVTSDGKAAAPAIPATTVTVPVSAPAASGKTYTVAPGDCLWTICKKTYGNCTKWGDLFVLNSDILKNPRMIYPGQVLRLF